MESETCQQVAGNWWRSSVSGPGLLNDQYPRVLLVLMTKVKSDDPVNLLIRTQFGGWPQEGLAQIHGSSEPPGHGRLCAYHYPLRACDRFLGGVFQGLRGGVLGMVAMDAVGEQLKPRPMGWLGPWWRLLKKRLGDRLIGSGLWELIFHVRLSKPLLQFVENFKPDLVYCQGYSLGFATLPLTIARRFHLPICFQTTDDWPSYTYRGFPMGWLLRRRARQLVAEAKVRLAFGEKMRRAYERRYAKTFKATYHLDDPTRFPEVSGIVDGPLQIVYTGSLGMRRYEAIQDLLDVVRALQDRARPIQIVLYCSGLPKDAPREVFDAPEVRFRPLPAHEELPRILASAAVLFLPESFTVPPEMIEYAISSKAHLYMMSGRPILVYGPAYSGTVGYAIEGGWAAVVAQRRQDTLKDSLSRLFHDSSWRAELGGKAKACVRSNHNLTVGREQFRQLLADAVSGAFQRKH